MDINDLSLFKLEYYRLVSRSQNNRCVAEDSFATVSYVINCGLDSQIVLQRVKDVLSCACNSILNDTSLLINIENLKDGDILHKNIIPSWFCDLASSFQYKYNESICEFIYRALLTWTGFSDYGPNTKVDYNLWSMSSWVYYLPPSNRYWIWYDSKIISKHKFEIDIEIFDCPFPNDSLFWLL